MRKLCDDLPAVIGAIKMVPEDFEVEELPAYLPSGEGSHRYLWIQKQGFATQEVVEWLARAIKVSPKEIGYAGQKDRQAVTRQWFSVPADKSGVLPESQENIKILKSELHGNKLKTGHLRGNHFRLRVRGAGNHEEGARQRLAQLEKMGVPNYYGAQRFGRDGDNAAQGRAILLGTGRAGTRHLRRLLLSSLQSSLFNRWLDARIDDGLYEQVLEGDLLSRIGSHATFVCESLELDQARLSAHEIDITGPMYGHKMRIAEGEAGAREQALLTAEELSLEAFKAGGKLCLGTRRNARILLKRLEIERDANSEDLWISFELPSGAYATVVMDQLLSTSESE